MPRSWTEIVADTGNTDLTWNDSGLAAATTYHYRVTGRNGAGLGTPSNEASGTTRPQAALPGDRQLSADGASVAGGDSAGESHLERA